MNPLDSRTGRNVLPKLLVAYLAFVLYLYLANWLAYVNLVNLPLGTLPSGSLLPLVLLGVVAVTLYNAKRKRRMRPDDKSAAQKS